MVAFKNPDSTDLRLCVDDEIFYVHRDILVTHSSYVSDFLHSPIKRQRSSLSDEHMSSVHIALPVFNIPEDLVQRDMKPLAAFEIFLCACYHRLDLAYLSADELISVAVIADFMISESIRSAVDGLIANLQFDTRSWTAALIFAKTFGLCLTCRKLLENQHIGLLERLTRLDVFFQLNDIEILAILRNLNIPILIKIFTTFWYCTGLRDDEFGRTNTLQVVGDAKSAAFFRFMEEIVARVNDRATLGFLLTMADRFELLSDSGQTAEPCNLYRMIARRAMDVIG